MKDVTNYFYNGGLNCAESTMRCLIENEIVDVPVETIRMMSGFGGGMQRGSVCGAVISAVAAIGSRTGRVEPDESRQPSADAVREFLRRFEKEFGTLYCQELQSTYVKDHALKSEGMYKACTVIVKKAVELTEEILRELDNKTI